MVSLAFPATSYLGRAGMVEIDSVEGLWLEIVVTKSRNFFLELSADLIVLHNIMTTNL